MLSSTFNLSTIILPIIILIQTTSSTKKSWSYSHQPWENGMCTTGRLQSPIVLSFPSKKGLGKYYQRAETKDDPLNASEFFDSLNNGSHKIEVKNIKRGRAIEFVFVKDIQSQGLICTKYVCHFNGTEHRIKIGQEEIVDFAEC